MAESKYRIVATTRFQRDLASLDRGVQDRILGSISSKLSRDPYSVARKLHGVRMGAGQWKFRVGDYRVRFDIEGKDIVLHRVAHRKEIYK